MNKYLITVYDDSPQLGDMRNPSILLAEIRLTLGNGVDIKDFISMTRTMFPSWVQINAYQVKEWNEKIK
jgi:hypothetical protein